MIELLLWLADVIFVSTDIYSWFKGERNGSERRKARQNGLEVLPGDPWNRRVILFSLLALAVTLTLVIFHRRSFFPRP